MRQRNGLVVREGLDGNLLACEQALDLDERSQPSENARASGRSCEGPRKGERSLQALLSLPHLPLWRLLSRDPRASTFHNIPQMESLLAGYSNLLVASCTLCSSKKTNVFWPYKEKERVKQKSNAISRRLKRKSVVSVMWLGMHM